MSVVTVQLGQCGNQMGFHFFDSLVDAMEEASSTKDVSSKTRENYVREIQERFFHERLPPFPRPGSSASTLLHARAVLIDMESKVVDRVTQEAESRRKRGDVSWSFNPRRIFSRKMGSGNNWANGFLNYGPRCKEEIIERVRQELENCDFFEGFLLLMSLAGGTGSGLGTATATMLQDGFGGMAGKTSVCQAVWPHSSGEVILQNYNTILSIAHLNQVSDAIIIHFNDILNYICVKRLNLKKVNFSDMNRLIAHHLSSLLCPSWPIDLTARRTLSKHRQPRSPEDDASKLTDQRLSPPKTALPSLSHASPVDPPVDWSKTRPKNELTDLVSQLTPHPGYRLLQSFSVPVMAPNCIDFSRDHWSTLVKSLRQMLINNVAVDEGLDWHIEKQKRNRSLVNRLHLRGVELDLRHVRDCHIGDDTGDAIGSGAASTAAPVNSARQFNFELLRDEEIYVPWIPREDCFRAFASPFSHGGYEKSATMLSNSSAISQPLDVVTHKAWKMFSAKAYLHQYESFGHTQDDFLDCFASVEQIINNYKEI